MKKKLTLLLALVLSLVLAAPAAWAEPVISNEVVITPVPLPDPDDPPVEPGLSLGLTTMPQIVSPGGALVASVVLSNTGGPATGVEITLDLSEGLTLADPSSVAIDPLTGMPIWTVDLPSGQMATIAVDVAVSENANVGDTLALTAKSGDMAAVATVVVADSVLRLGMTSTVKRAEPGDAVHYNITLSNEGDMDAANVAVSCATGGMIVDLARISHGGTYMDDSISWSVNVPAHSKIVLDYLADVPDDAEKDEVYVAIAAVQELTATASVTVIQPEPILSIVKKVNNRTPAPGTTVKYTIRVINEGGAEATDVMIVDTLPEDIEIYENSITDGGDYDGYDDTIEWYVDVPAYDEVVLTFKAYVPDWADDGDVYVNRARIKGGDSAKATLTVTEDAVPKTGYGDVVPAAWSNVPAVGDEQPANAEDIPDAPLPAVQEAFLPILEQNADVVGWLKVADQVDLPVLQHEGNDYYMTHNFDGKEDEAGALFLDERNHLEPRDSHLLIYGHNMKSGAMFGKLAEYRSADYLKANPLFTFQSIYDAQPTQYVPVAVLDASMDVGNADYLKIRVPNFDDEQAMLDFVQSMRDASYFDIPVEVTSEDTLMTLVTCSYLQDNGRFLIVARPLRADETPEQMAELVAQAQAKA